jgi:hypothetical protein
VISKTLVQKVIEFKIDGTSKRNPKLVKIMKVKILKVASMLL